MNLFPDVPFPKIWSRCPVARVAEIAAPLPSAREIRKSGAGDFNSESGINKNEGRGDGERESVEEWRCEGERERRDGSCVHWHR